MPELPTRIKNVISFTDKTRFLFQISKGLVGPEARSAPFAVNERTDRLPGTLQEHHLRRGRIHRHPVLSLYSEGRRAAQSPLYDRDNRAKVGRAYGFVDDRRVSHVVPTNYTKNSGADSAITLAIDSIKSRILSESSE